MNKKLPIINQQAKLNDDQTTFNEYILKVNELKNEIAEVEAQIEAARARVDKEITPLQEQVVDCRQAYIERLDSASEMFYYSLYEKRQMKAMIIEEGFTLISQAGRSHLKAIYDKYADTPYDELEQEANDAANEFIRDFVKDNFGVDADNLDLENWNSFKELSKKLPKAVSEADINLEAESLKKQSRAVYTQLAKNLHPDSETDPEKKAEKTILMQQLTEAYKSNDFFELLSMQALHARDADMIEVDETLLPEYNETLRRQIMEQEIQLKVLKNPPEPMFNVYGDYCGNTPEEIETKFAKKRAYWQDDLETHLKFIDQIEDRYALRLYLRGLRYDKDDNEQEKDDSIGLSDVFPVLKFWGL